MQIDQPVWRSIPTDGKTITGFDVELFDAVATKLGLETEWQPANFADIIPGLQSGKYEVGVSSFTINRERKQEVNMVSYFNAGTQWATKKGNPTGIQPDSACGKKVAVQTATVEETKDLPKRQQACKSGGRPTIIIDRYQDQDQATAAVVSARTTPCWPTSRWWSTPSSRPASWGCFVMPTTRRRTVT